MEKSYNTKGEQNEEKGNCTCYENKTRSQKLNLDNKCFQQL